MPNKNTKGPQRLGRPRLPPDRTRTERVVTFLTAQEYAELKVLADGSGESLSAATHQLVAAALRRRRQRQTPPQSEK